MAIRTSKTALKSGVAAGAVSVPTETPKAETPKATKAKTPKAETPKAETPKAETPKTPKGKLPKIVLPTVSSATQLPVEAVKIAPGFNVRTFNPLKDKKDAALLASVADVGIEVPISVRLVDGVPFIQDGHRRYQALCELIAQGKTEARTIPAVLARDKTDSDRTAFLYTANDAKPLQQFEQAAIVLRLREYEWKEADIAKRFGVTVRQIQNLALLGKASKATQALVVAGPLSSTLATKIAAAYRDELQQAAIVKHAAEIAAAEGKAITEKHVKQAAAAKGAAAFKGRADSAKAAKAEAEAAKAEAAKAKAEAAAAVAAAKTAGAPGTVSHVGPVPTVVMGPFRAFRDVIRDAAGADIGAMRTSEIASYVVILLNAGWNMRPVGSEGAHDVTPKAEAGKGRGKVPLPPAPMQAHGRKAVKPAPAAPAAPTAPTVRKGKPGRSKGA